MAYAEKDVIILKPVEQVYNFLADGLNNRKWRNTVLEINLMTGKSGQAGATYRQVIKGPGGRRVQADYKITKTEANKRISFKVIAGPSRPDGHFFLTPADGGTRLTFMLDLPLTGIVRLLMDRAVSKRMQDEVDRVFALKRLLEREESR